MPYSFDTGVLGCVTPFYGTAQIEPGTHVDVGLAVGPVIGFYSPRVDLGIRHGFKEYFQINGSIGIMYGGDELPVFPAAGLGVQAEAPLGVVTPACGVEVSFPPPAVTPTFLLGIGRNEWLTLGGRLYIFSVPNFFGSEEEGRWITALIPQAFITGHLWSRLSIFAGVGFAMRLIAIPIVAATLGVGYKIQ